MESPLIVVILIAAGLLALLLAWRAVRFLVRLALLGVLLLALLAGGYVWWWQNSGDSAAPSRKQRPADTRRVR
ncbi:MAG: hypothetical protein ACRD9R_11825 [Pyrinomonadaceae bacterium]